MLNPLLEGAEMFAVYEGSPEQPELIANGVIGCSPGHPVMNQLLNEINIESGGAPWEMVGPLYFTRLVAKYPTLVRLYPSHFFYPFHYTNRRTLSRSISRSDPRLAESYLVQYWGTTTQLYGNLAHRFIRKLRLELSELGLRR
jgi:hypothetical protein